MPSVTASAPEDAPVAARTARHEAADVAHDSVSEHKGETLVGRVAPGVRKGRGKWKASGAPAPGTQTG